MNLTRFVKNDRSSTVVRMPICPHIPGPQKYVTIMAFMAVIMGLGL